VGGGWNIISKENQRKIVPLTESGAEESLIKGRESDQMKEGAGNEVGSVNFGGNQKDLFRLKTC